MSEFAKTVESFMRGIDAQADADERAGSARPAAALQPKAAVAPDLQPRAASSAPVLPQTRKLDPGALRDRLGGLDLLRGMGPELLDAIVARCPLRELEPGVPLLTAGQTNSEIFVILAGELNVYLDDRRDVPVAVLRGGDTVGELSAIDKKPTSATVVAHVPTLLLCIDETMFWHVIHASHGFAVRLMLKLAERLRANNSTVQANMELASHFEAVALSDALTGVHSRRWLDETLPRLCDRHRFDGQPITLAMVDVDHFKRINDQFGHPTGDLVLVELARTMRTKLRPTDFVARFGGEEFVLIFPHTSLAGAAIASERLREAVRVTILKHADGSQIPCATVSIGLSELQPGQDVARLLHTADEALYRAKHKGRNRVES
jgi:diguanylate cyclase (GGDEF)-like protein